LKAEKVVVHPANDRTDTPRGATTIVPTIDKKQQSVRQQTVDARMGVRSLVVN
jgi:hypothetical protein